MADYFQSQPNFTNPSYATPEQLAAQRAYAEALTKRSGENVNRPTGALANMITALTGNLERNRAAQIQQEAAGQNAGDISALISQLQQGKSIDPQTAGRVYANPMASPEHRGLIGALVTPKVTEDVAGRPATVSPSAGAQGLPVQGYEPGYRTPESAGSVSTTTAISAPPFPGGRVPMPAPAPPRMDAVSPQGGIFGGMNSSPVGWNSPTPTLPTPVPASAPSVGSRIDALAAKDRALSAEKERTQGGAKGESNVIESDIKRASSAPETLKGLGIMKNTINSVGDSMTFGPTAKFSNEARRVISNYAPGLVDEKALAGADAIEKLNLGLAGALSSQLGLNPSDIYRSVASVPGNEKSKQGTLALINMMEQAARNDQYVGTTLYQNSKGDLGAYQLARAAYYAHHPIVNPITGNSIDIDASKPQNAAASYEKTATNPQTGQKMGLRNGQWEPIK